MQEQPDSSLSRKILIQAIEKFGEQNPDKIRRYTFGTRFIQEGELSKEMYLIVSGEVRITIREKDSKVDRLIINRYPGEIIGETAFLQYNSPRTASVDVISESVVVVALTKEDVFEILKESSELQDSVIHITQLKRPREIETAQVLKGEFKTRDKIMSVLLADIHNFTSVGEFVWEEFLNSFLFEFIEGAEEIILESFGTFEDQGDGFKALFDDRLHAQTAVKCAIQIQELFLSLRRHWARYNSNFKNIGLGIGICSGTMSIRKMVRSRNTQERAYSHSINLASAIAKDSENVSETTICVNEQAYQMISKTNFRAEKVNSKWLKKLSKPIDLYKITEMTMESTTVVDLAKIVLPPAVAFLFTELKTMLAERRERKQRLSQPVDIVSLPQGINEDTEENIQKIKPINFDEHMKEEIEHYLDVLALQQGHRRTAELKIARYGGIDFVAPPVRFELENAEDEIIKYSSKLKKTLEKVYGQPINIEGLE